MLLGFVYAGLLNKFDLNKPYESFREFRWAGVLPRIGICYFIAAWIVLLFRAGGPRDWSPSHCSPAIPALLTFVSVGGAGGGDYSKQGNLAGYIDQKYLPGTIMPAYYGYGDNEGILSTLGAGQRPRRRWPGIGCATTSGRA